MYRRTFSWAYELRIYPEALPPEQIAALHRDGAATIAARYEALNQRLASLYPANAAFAETCAALRESLAQRPDWLDEEYAQALALRLKGDFPEACGQFAEWAGVSPIEYILTASTAFHEEKVGRLIELLLEYKPITEDQWRKQSPEDVRKWEESERLRERFDNLLAQGDAARFSPEWVELVMAAGPAIDFRPYVHEPVAPYIRPSTPETRALTREEARQALEKDWLHQADGAPSPERIRDEIAWARDLAARIDAAYPGQVDFQAELSRLDALDAEAKTLSEPHAGFYFRVARSSALSRCESRSIHHRALCRTCRDPQGSEWPHETRHRLGYMAVPGGKLVILDGLHPGGEVRQLVPQAPLHGSFWRPDVSYDASKVLFCFKPHNEKSFHLYEINVDGTGLTQLTDGPYDDFDPIYLPDEEHVVFSTTLGNTMSVACSQTVCSCALRRDAQSISSRPTTNRYCRRS